MIYDRTFRFSASHYGPAHHALARACELEGSMTWDAFKSYNAMLHGHNFKVQVLFGYDEHRPDESVVPGTTRRDAAALPIYGVWDQDIERVVMQWANCNISMHPDFYKAQWTSSTEAIAEVLAAKLFKTFPEDVRWLEVTVHETEDISVMARVDRAKRGALT